MKLSSLMEVLVAAHLSAHVDPGHFPERGGIMLMAPPGNFKTTAIKMALQPYTPKACLMSDINVETIGRMKNHIASGQITTLALPAFEKIYERNPQTAKNVEGHLKGMVDEGFSQMSFQDQRMLGQLDAKCLVIGGLVQVCYQKHFNEWDDNGFLRRFIWSSFQLANSNILIEAVHNWARIEFDNKVPLAPQNKIKMSVTKDESHELRRILSQQNVEATPFTLMKKILSVLKWKYGEGRDKKLPLAIMHDFGDSLGQRMAKLEI